jgi:hypothetical protein
LDQQDLLVQQEQLAHLLRDLQVHKELLVRQEVLLVLRVRQVQLAQLVHKVSKVFVVLLVLLVLLELQG